MRSDAGRRWIDGPVPWLVYLPFYAMPWIWLRPTAFQLIGSAVGLALFLPIYLHDHRWTGRRQIVAAITVLVIAVALAPLGGSWTVIAVYAAAMAGNVRPPRRAVVTIAVFAIVTAGVGLLLRQSLLWWLPGLLLVMMTGFATVSREAFYDRNQALLASQEEVRRLAGTAERERIARDLHDVVGRTLTLVALKADLAIRLLARDPAGAEAEMRGVAETAREGLGEVRAALAGQSGGSLAREASASQAALAAAGVTAEFAGDPGAVAADAGAVLAMTLREAVTNVIRHADAGHCTMLIGIDGTAARLVVEDDGRGGAIREGNGLSGMRQRLTAAGGTLAIADALPGTRLVASVPVTTP